MSQRRCFIFSETIFDVNYENLVNEPETHIRKVIKYCDLEWEDQCLKFHETIEATSFEVPDGASSLFE